MKKFIAATSLVLLLSVSTAAPAHAEDDPSIMQSGTPSSQLEVTTDDGSSMRAQGSEVQPAGTGTSATDSNIAAPDPAVQTFMAGESDGSRQVSDTQPIENDSKAPLYIGAAIAIFGAMAVFGVIYYTYLKR